MQRRASKSKRFTAVDLFAGGGGLTLGLKRAGFHVVGAVELEPHAFATYKANHPEVHAFKQDVCTVKGACLRKLSPTGQIDLLVGCPPCQGFSSLTSKYRRADPRNALVMEMARLIEEVRPRVVMMENVPGLAMKGRRLFKRFLKALSSLGYVQTHDVLQVADYGVPQSRRRLVLVAGKGFAITLPAPTHARKPDGDLEPWRPIRTIIEGMSNTVTLSESREHGGPQACDWHVVRTLAPQNRQRLARAKPGEAWTRIPKRLRPNCHKDKSAGFSNVYGRMSWDQVSPTITGGCTTLSKGRFGHPEEDRTISVREAALLQTFPPDYMFDSPFIDRVCDVIGNALPCDFAEILARQCRDALRCH
ncbi:MAG: DNA cytosine methyltransferase [Phycisphaerae bacterium]|nr:DNA cytosine methyltransferase [Phycisphaerae bacterium]